MTKLLALSVYDSKTEEYTTPHYAKTNGEAIRSFEQVCKDPNTNLNKYPSDFSLELIGEFNTATSQFTSTPIKQLSHASEFIQNQNTEI